MFRSAMMAALLVTGLAGHAQAQEGMQVFNFGEEAHVEYPAGYTGNIVGGGAVRVSGQGESQQIAHMDSRFAQHPAGIPVFVGGSEGNVAYVPAGESTFGYLAHR